ncbi:hypothetical protein FO519_005977 [Halicephalobus sp. NKZ332]|nr:hypothetical protein FO519_005977 [Halicephalobus sp. NKZ332]
MLRKVILLALLPTVFGLYFHIAETERKCFIEEIPDETMVIGNYKVQLYDPNTKGYGDYPNIGMHVEVKDPEEKVILSKLYTSEGRFTFTSHTPGEHLICLYSNSSAWFSGAQLRVHLDIQVGEHAQDYEQVAQKDKLNELQLRIRQLLDQMALRRLVDGLKSPWSLAFSGFGAAYGIYYIIDTTQAGTKYEPDFDLKGKTYIVTGATSGIGQATVEELARRNARVIMACRNREKCIQVRRDIVLSTRNKQIFCRQCDLSDFDSIRSFVAKLSQGKFELDRIDGVVNNAATMDDKRKLSKSGIEQMLMTNHMGSFLMTGLLLEKLFKQENPVKIVFLNTNIINRKCDIDFDDLNNDKKEKFDGYEVYKQTKLAQAMFAKELSEKVKDSNVSVILTDPGRTKTSLSNKLNAQDFFLSRWLLKPISFIMGQRRPEKAVKPILYALADPEADGLNGVFIDRERQLQDLGEIVEDKEKREKLWSISLAWTRFHEHLNQLKKEVSGDEGSVEDKPTETKAGGRWYYLWLA